MNYLITGVAGFIGSQTAKAVLKAGHQVIGIDNFTTGFRENVPEEVLLIKGNCQDRNVIDQLEECSIDVILHIAGQSSGEISYDDPVYDLQTNTQSTLMLLDIARKKGCKHFVYASSMSVYGDVPDQPITEQHPCDPKSFYAVGKLASEQYLKRYSAQYHLPCTALRLFNVYGPGQNMENMRQGMVSIFLAQAIREGAIQVKGSKDRFRDFIYIDDVVNAFLKVADAPPAYYECYNVCSGIKTHVKEIIAGLQDAIEPCPQVEYAGSTPGDQFGIYGNPNKLYQQLGVKAAISFEEGLQQMIDFYQSTI
ncbi:MAG: NAD-dependent epimerase/dehydratase family protein [Cyclobacteriaceae bacterium]|nr:NAD-dependent epimerase/dehydratase family protein [Cyclobacteriaceae bacterium]MCH8516926.1 NAD-dependent epimerase/dehydratase family protein [Cyclobacteriaceae bacterium]